MTKMTEDFLSEAAKSYLDALAAIEAFEENVRSVCKDVYKRHQTELVSKMELEDAECDDYDYKEPANRYAALGVRQDTKSEREAFYVYVIWDGATAGTAEMSACVDLEFSTKNERKEAYQKLHRNPACSIQHGDDGSYPYLRLQKNLSELSSSAEALDQLVNEWLACWPAGRRLE